MTLSGLSGSSGNFTPERVDWAIQHCSNFDFSHLYGRFWQNCIIWQSTKLICIQISQVVLNTYCINPKSLSKNKIWHSLTFGFPKLGHFMLRTAISPVKSNFPLHFKIPVSLKCFFNPKFKELINMWPHFGKEQDWGTICNTIKNTFFWVWMSPPILWYIISNFVSITILLKFAEKEFLVFFDTKCIQIGFIFWPVSIMVIDLLGMELN